MQENLSVRPVKDLKGLTDAFYDSEKVKKTLWFSDWFIFKRQLIYSGWKGRSVLNCNPGQKSWASLHFWGVFPLTRDQPLPSTTNNVGRVYPEFFSEFQLCIGWRGRELQENFERMHRLEGTEKRQKNMNIAVLSQGLLSMIVGKTWKGRHLSVEGTYIRIGYRLRQKWYIKE